MTKEVPVRTHETARITRWNDSQHPNRILISNKMKAEGLRPYQWNNAPNHRFAVRSHNYHKVLYVLEGSLEVTLPDQNASYKLRPGDRIDLPAGVRHGLHVGYAGVVCLEAGVRRQPARH